MDQDEFSGMGPIYRDFALNVVANGVKKGTVCWFGQIKRHESKDGPPISKQEMPDLFGLTYRKEIKVLGVLNVRMALSFKTYSSTLGRSRKHSLHQYLDK